ncbi:MAG: intradiol ring-cleavage dioxygenase [Anaerolineales bacterium]
MNERPYEMDNDDRLIGRILSRREALSVLGATGAAVLVGCAPGGSEPEPETTVPTQAAAATETEAATAVPAADALPTCVVRPEMTEGPYFVDEQLNRPDIRSDPSSGSVKEGALLELSFRVSEVSNSTCNLLEGVFVDIWHCDAMGVYSDAENQGFNTVGQKFLRGYQVTDANGIARFTTIYPGWYFSRAVHIHFKIRSELSANSSYEFTSQLFFDDALSDQVFAAEPYASQGQRTIRNGDDGIFQQGGSQLLLEVSQSSSGYAATFDIGLEFATSS